MRTQAPVQAEKTSAPPQIPAASDSLNWSTLAFDLGLQGMTQQVAINSIVVEYSTQALKLALLPELESLLKPALVEQINQALNTALDVSLKLDIVSQPELNVETPHQANERKKYEQHQADIEAIKQQVIVKQLGDAFGAQLLENSVKPIET